MFIFRHPIGNTRLPPGDRVLRRTRPGLLRIVVSSNAGTIVGILLAIPLIFVALLLGILELILVITDDEGRRLGDKIANTMVIEVDE